MSVNRYSTESGLQTLANGQRIWIGTRAAYDAEKQAGTLPSNCLIAITDDSEDNNYSTDEKLTGKFWIDGKPIYRKVIDTGALPDINTKTVAHNISNIDLIIKNYGFAWSTDVNKTTIPLPYTNTVGSTNVTIYASKSLVYLKDTEALSSEYPNSYVILEYTKTTD